MSSSRSSRCSPTGRSPSGCPPCPAPSRTCSSGARCSAGTRSHRGYSERHRNPCRERDVLRPPVAILYEVTLTEQRIENVIIVGSGPAGYTAALYTARANLEPLVIEGFAWGGLLQQTTDVENYPGFPEGIMGPEMMQHFRAQAERFGARLETDDATRIEVSREGGLHKVWTGDQVHVTRALILAMGAQHRKLDVPGEAELAGRGVSYCATCDAAFFRQAPTLIVGGGDSAMEEAMFLSKFAAKVAIVHRRDDFRASKIMLERARAIPNIEWLTPYVVEEFSGENGSLGVARLRNTADGSSRELEVTGAFIAIGHEPQSQLVISQVETDAAGYVVTKGRSTLTGVPGVFAAGDLVDHTYRQAVTAAGSGCQAALDAEWYLRDTPFPLTEAETAEAAAGASA
ncbi:MAG: thioredoxin-disulfide reductase [Solirubrobacterales bacterium]|nr:thioredoxin-disulfide reductase [Solirubrobacterales bacterium]